MYLQAPTVVVFSYWGGQRSHLENVKSFEPSPEKKPYTYLYIYIFLIIFLLIVNLVIRKKARGKKF